MAIDIVREVFPGAEVSWERTGRVANPKLVVTEPTKAFEIASVMQQDMSDDYLGDGAAEFKQRLEEFKVYSSRLASSGSD